MSDDRETGLEFGDLLDDLKSEEYPLSKAAVVDKYGDREVEHATGSATIREILGPEGDDEYQDFEEVHQTVFNMVGEEAVGREEYTDRSTDSSRPDSDQQSL